MVASPFLGDATIADLCAEGDIEITDAAEFVRVVCAGVPRRGASAELAADALRVFRAGARDAAEAAARYGAAARRGMDDAYRDAYAEWSAETQGGRSSSIGAALAADGPEAWAPLWDWPLVKVLCYMEDRAWAAFRAELDAATEGGYE